MHNGGHNGVVVTEMRFSDSQKFNRRYCYHFNKSGQMLRLIHKKGKKGDTNLHRECFKGVKWH